MQTAQLFHGSVKFQAGQPLDTKYGRRINAVVTLDNGEEVKLWDSPGGSVANLRKGQAVTLMHNGKGYLLVASTPEHNGNGNSTSSSDDEDIAEIAIIYHELRRSLPPETSESAIVSLTQSIFKYRRS